MLTLLVITSFYDSIEIGRDRAVAKFHVREQRWNPFVAFMLTGVELLLALTGVRTLWRLGQRLLGRRTAVPVVPAK